MNESDAMKLMKSPKDVRHGIWRGGVMQIHITRACDKSCFGCTQGSNLGGKPVMMTPEQFEEACRSLKGYWGVVGVFGGNPCLSIHFEEICAIFRRHFPYDQRGLWSNHPKGHGATCRKTFNPSVSNLNVHLDQGAYDEFVSDWPECKSIIKGLHEDSRHSPPYVAMQDVVESESDRWQLISRCDVNRLWSAMVCVVRGQVKGFFCELAGAQSMLHQDDDGYPDTGIAAVPGWWEHDMNTFAVQVRYHCMACGIPLRGYGSLAVGGESEQVSVTHQAAYRPKSVGRLVQLVTDTRQLGKSLDRATDYVENGKK